MVCVDQASRNVHIVGGKISIASAKIEEKLDAGRRVILAGLGEGSPGVSFSMEIEFFCHRVYHTKTAIFVVQEEMI